MAKKTVYICDRPGCKKEVAEAYKRRVSHVSGPYRDIYEEEWDLCKDCRDELDQAKLQAELGFSARLLQPKEQVNG